MMMRGTVDQGLGDLRLSTAWETSSLNTLYCLWHWAGMQMLTLIKKRDMLSYGTVGLFYWKNRMMFTNLSNYNRCCTGGRSTGWIRHILLSRRSCARGRQCRCELDGLGYQRCFSLDRGKVCQQTAWSWSWAARLTDQSQFVCWARMCYSSLWR